jgi:hypothetical protein
MLLLWRTKPLGEELSKESLCAGIDFDEVFAPVARLESVWFILTIAAHCGWTVHHLDVKSAFLNGDLVEEVYVEQPPGFVVQGKEGKVYKLHKPFYGLRQAPRSGTPSSTAHCCRLDSGAAQRSTLYTYEAPATIC